MGAGQAGRAPWRPAHVDANAPRASQMMLENAGNPDEDKRIDNPGDFELNVLRTFENGGCSTRAPAVQSHTPHGAQEGRWIEASGCILGILGMLRASRPPPSRSCTLCLLSPQRADSGFAT